MSENTTSQIIGKNTYIDYSDCKDCAIGKKFCSRACWPIPEEAKKIMDAGLGNKLMLDYWVAPINIYILCPATPGFESKDAPDPDNPWEYLDILSGLKKDPLKGGCTFQDPANGYCVLHDIALKPAEGRKTCCKARHKELHEDIAMTWNTAEGQELIKEWKERFYKK